ncbi:hypothetical protein P691DRAFT_690304, partial [Macrolepiota fuliginosa MF-IS2]
RYAQYCIWFTDAYANGLTRKQAAWALKKYQGHKKLPPSWRVYVYDCSKFHNVIVHSYCGCSSHHITPRLCDINMSYAKYPVMDSHTNVKVDGYGLQVP